MIFEVKCDERRTNLRTYEPTDRTHTRIVSFISTDGVVWYGTAPILDPLVVL